ncbi:hypothetical protein AGIG_G25099 [Arapaima gigas]
MRCARTGDTDRSAGAVAERPQAWASCVRLRALSSSLLTVASVTQGTAPSRHLSVSTRRVPPASPRGAPASEGASSREVAPGQLSSVH